MLYLQRHWRAAMTPRIGALYRILWAGEWKVARYVAKDEWQWPEPPCHRLVSHPAKIGEEVLEVPWARDPFAAVMRMSAMVRVL